MTEKGMDKNNSPAPTGFPRRRGGKNSAEAQPDGIAFF